MKLTFTVLLACWTIYSSSHAVLSLPPSLIANAASLQHHQHDAKVKRERPASTANSNTLLHKDVATSTSGSAAERATYNEGGSIIPDTITRTWNINSAKDNEHLRKIRMAEISSGLASALASAQHSNTQRILAGEAANAADVAYDLNGFLQATATKTDDETSDNTDDDTSQSMYVRPLLLPPTQQTATRIRQSQADANEFFTPLKYWARHCQPDRNCPQQYYRALFANRNNNKAAAALAHLNGFRTSNEAKNVGGVNETVALPLNHELNSDGNSDIYDDSDSANNYAAQQQQQQKLNNDIFMFLNGEKDLIKFLRWAMLLLYSNEKFANNTANSAEHYHPSMYIWKKLNLSGNLEPPLFVEEPHYIIVRREQLSDDIKMNSRYANNDPFIPPRGRKHNMPDLDALLHRYETFVPNRGKRDKIKDMLKSDDLFFPNRGKKLKPSIQATMKRDLEYENGNIKNGNRNATATAASASASAISSNDVDIDESKSSNDYNDNDDDDDDWKRALPIAILVRDVLEKLLQENVQNQKNHRQLKAAGNKITTNAHEINYYDDNSNDPEWRGTMLNYKFNGYDPSVKQSMPLAVAISGETREMSTPQKVAAAARDHVLQQLLKQQIQRNDDETGASGVSGDIVGIGVDRGGTKIATNRLLSTRSMSTAMAHRRQQQQQYQRQQQQRQKQKERLRQLQKQRNLLAISQPLDVANSNEYPQWLPKEEDQRQQQQRNYQVKSLTNPDPFLWRQLQLLQRKQQIDNGIQNFQQKNIRQHQQGSWPQETLITQRDAFDSPYTQGYTRANARSGAFDNDYNYADI